MANAKDLSEQDRQLAEQDRNFALGRGDDLFSRSTGRADQDTATRDQYRGSADQQNALIQSGYTPEEAAQIMQSGGLDALGFTKDQADANYLTPDEQAGIKGDPNSRFNYYQPDYTSGVQTDAAGLQRHSVDAMRGSLNDAIDVPGLSVGADYGSNVGAQLNATDTGVAGTVGDTERNVRGAIDPNKLAQDSAAAGRIRMTPEQQQDIVTGAGISAGTGYRAAVGTAERQARAAGASPMGVAAYRSRMERDSAGEAGDAMTKARVDASNAAAQREMDLEKNRQGAEQYISSETAANEQQLGAAKLGAQERSGARRLAANSDVEDRRLGSARDISTRRTQAAETGGQADIANERAIGAQNQDVARYNQDAGTAIQTGAEKDAATRAGTLATNRQGVTEGNSQTGYQRGMDINTALSNRSGQVANTRLGAGSSSRDYYGGVATQDNANAQNEYKGQNDIYGTQTGAMNRATGNANDATKGYIAANAQPGTFGKIVSGAAGAAGAFFGGGFSKGGIVTEPTAAVLGEDGPEAVVPLGDDSKKRSAFSRYGEAALRGLAKGGLGGAVGGAIGAYRQKRDMDRQQMPNTDSLELGSYLDSTISKASSQTPEEAPYVAPITAPDPSVAQSQPPLYRAPWGQQNPRQPARQSVKSRFYGMSAA